MPVNSVESVIRDQSVIIEYNPRTGGVYSVFYAEGNPFLAEDYRHGRLQRNEEWLKKNTMGYYNGSDLTGEELGFYEVVAGLSYVNGQEGILNIDIPTQYLGNGVVNLVKNGNANYIKGMDIHLTVIGETSGIFTKQIKKAGEDVVFTEVIGGEGASNVLRIPVVLDSLVTVRDENNKVKGTGLIYDDENINKNDGTYSVKPGDNVSFVVEVTYVPGSTTDELILFDDAVLGGVNPLFHAVTGEEKVNNEGGYTVAIANGRHLQNLNALDPAIAAHVKTVTFVNEDGSTDTAPVVDWAETTKYYFTSNLKYFAPIDNANLVDAEIDGKHTVISNLSIASDGALNTYDYYADSASDQSEVGLFRRINGAVRDLRISNPVIRGGSNSEAVGALAGSAGTEAVVNNCYVYVDTDEKNYVPANLDLTDNFSGENGKYGVSGYTAVGGMVGYSNDADFTNSLASVPVCGNMNTAGTTVGVGGFVGAAKDGSFTKCYTGVRTLGSGAVFANQNAPASCGLGGFVGTSDNAYYTNCFASGHVTNTSNTSNGANTRAATGGFVGIANSSKTALFNACYALGTVRATDGSGIQQAKFVGESISAIKKNVQDYYRDLLNDTASGHIFRDCYYLRGKTGVLDADDYTLSASFDMLYSIYNFAAKEPYYEYLASALDTDAGTVESQIGQTHMQNSGFWHALKNWRQGLVSKNESGHHPYVQGYKNHGANYPYSMITGMPFYGTWPDAPAEIGIGYWEIYAEENGETSIGFYYDQVDGMSLKDKTVLADGYVILSANNGTKEVTFTGDTAKEIYISVSSKIRIDDSEYYYGVIPVNAIPVSQNFYTKVELKGSEFSGTAKDYVAYFNPNVAASQISPAGEGTANKVEAKYPGDDFVPKNIVIRSPRQLTALAGDAMKPFWDESFVLYGNIDYAAYGIEGAKLISYGMTEEQIAKIADYGMVSQTFTSIGTVEKPMENVKAAPFTGKLSGYNGAATVQVTGAGTGLVGVLGTNGKVSGITITGTMELGENEGALVNVMNGGTLENCTVNAVITSNSDTAGLVVGKLNGGTISNCKSTGANERLAFVGNTTKPVKVAIDTTATHSGAAKFEDGIYTPDEIKELKPVEGSEKVTEYTCTITEDCTYVKNGSVVPAVKNTYYYSVSDKNTYMQSETPATEFVAESGIKLSRFGTDESGWKPAGLYYQLMGRYLPVSVKIEKNTETIYPAASVEDTGSADNGETDASEPESSETTVTPEPEIKTTYTYTFGYELNDNYIPLSGDKVTENPDSYTITDMTLYSLKEPQKNSTYILVSGTQALKADDFLADINSGIVGEMVWTVGEDGNWYIGEKTIKVILDIPNTGASQYPKVKVGEMEYQAYAVELTTAREVKLVNQDSVYATTYQPVEED